MSKQNSIGKRRYYLVYSGVFLLMAAVAFSFFYINGKSFVYETDGLRQHFTALAYYGHYLRDILKTLFLEHSLQIPMFDFQIGFGSDIITTLHYYVIGDPLNLLSVAVPMKYTEYLFCFLVLLRIYLAGLAFSAYSFYEGNGKGAVLFGTILYVFSGWVLFASVRHPYFTNPMIYFPLILIGIDKIYKKEKPYLFIGMTALAGLSNFYFFYMICIFMFLYAAFRYFTLFKRRSGWDVLRWLGKFMGYFAVGAAIAAVLLLPAVMLMLGTDRFNVDSQLLMAYDRKYLDMFMGSLMGKTMNHFTAVGVSAVGMLGVMVLFLKRKKYTAMKIAFLMMIAFLLVPFAGHVINGFSYAANRWTWAYLTLVSYMNVKAFPEYPVLVKKERGLLYLTVMIYCGLALLGKSGHNIQNLCAIVLLLVSCAAVYAAHSFPGAKRFLPLCLSASLAAGIFTNAWGQYKEGEEPYVYSFIDRDKAMYTMETPAAEAVKQAQTGDSEFFRYDQAESGDDYNSSLLSKVNGTQYFFSLSSPAISQFSQEMYLNTPFEQAADGLDSRVILDRLASVKYFAVGEGREGYLPYGYDSYACSAKKGETQACVYTTGETLPLGYTYDTYLPRKEYENLNVEEKQEAMLQSVVLEESSLKEGAPSYDSRDIPFEMTAGKGCEISDGKIKVREEKAQLKLTFRGLPESETYLIAKVTAYAGVSPRAKYTDEAFQALPQDEQEEVLDSEKYWHAPYRPQIVARAGKVTRTIKYMTKKFNFYSGRHEFIANLGYRKNALTKMTLSFPKLGDYTIADLRVACQPMKNLDQYTHERKENVLEDVSIETNRITGRITLDRPKALLFSVPYNKGWRVYVDGQERKLKQANTMFMAVELGAGEHRVKLTYRTPYLLPGLCISFAGIFAFFMIIYYNHSQKKRTGHKERRK